MSKIYFDESNNSGENLLDADQPVFTVAAVLLDDVAATACVEAVLAPLPPRRGEPKYSSLVRSRSGRSALLSVLPILPPGAARTFIAHKQFMIISKMVDYLVVELAFDDGYDMYADGSAVALANLLHLTGPVLGDANTYEAMLAAFVDAIRPNRPATLDDLFTAIAAYCATLADDYAMHAGLLLAARRQAEDLTDLIDARKIRDVLDPAIPCLIELARAVGAEVGPFHLVHDASKTIARHLPTLLSLDRLPPVTAGLPAEALPVLDIAFADSSTTPQLVIADWVAGAARHVAQTRLAGAPADPFAEQLGPTVEGWLVGGVWPNEHLIDHPRRINARPDARLHAP